MKSEECLFSKAQLDFITEMFSIGIGNAATAFSQLLKTPVDISVPNVYVLSDVSKLSPSFSAISANAVIVKMRMVGDITGSIYFIVVEEQTQNLLEITKKAMLNQERKPIGPPDSMEFNFSVLSEIGNILAGVFLNSTYDFCRLRVFHTVPIVERDNIQSLFNILGERGKDYHLIILIETEFTISKGKTIKTYFMIAVPDKSLSILSDSINNAVNMLIHEQDKKK